MPLSEQDKDRLFENLMQSTSDSIYFKDLESRFIMVNQTCANKHGWDPAEVKGKTDFDTFTKEHAEQAFADEQQIIRTGKPLRAIEEKETWPDGRETWASTAKIPLRDNEGNIIGTFGISRDITKRKQAEQRARLFAEEIQAIKEEIEDDVQMAGQLQQGFFPRSYPYFVKDSEEGGETCVEFLHRFASTRQVSGDYCAIWKVSDHEAGLFLCDISGTGVRAALGTALIRGIMPEVSSFAGDPGAYLFRMNNLLVPLLGQEGSVLEVKACYMVLNAREGTVRAANAGNPVPIHFSSGQCARRLFSAGNGGGSALAIEKDRTFEAVECTVAEGDSVVMFTDGLYTVNNSNDDTYGLKRLLDCAHSLADESLTDIFDGLEGDAVSFAWNNAFADDVCMVGFKLDSRMQ